jgi:hypothetical protein
MTPLAQCIIGCCTQNITKATINTLLTNPQIPDVIHQVARKHFPHGRSDFNGSVISGHDELLTCSMGTLLTALTKPRKEDGSIGFPNSWLTMPSTQIESNFKLWIRSRLLGDINEKHNCGPRQKDPNNLNSRARQFSSLSRTNDDGQSEEVDIATQNDPEALMIFREEQAKRKQMTDLVVDMPLISIRQVLEHITAQTEMTWALFPKINATSVCKWVMSTPKTCLEQSLIEQLWPHTKFKPTQLIRWNQNRHAMQNELDTANASFGKITKEYTVVALSNHASIQTYRAHYSAKKERETLRKNTNLTESGIYWLCLIASLRMHGTTTEGMFFQNTLVNFCLDKAEMAFPESDLDFKTIVHTFVMEHCQNRKEVRIGKLIELIALLRYGTNHDVLAQGKRDNCRRIALVASHIARQISRKNPLAPIKK